MKIVDFSETIAASYLKVGRNRHLIEIMMVSIEGQGHFLTLAQGRVHTKVGRTGLMVRASDFGSGDPGSILGRVGVFVSLSKKR